MRQEDPVGPASESLDLRREIGRRVHEEALSGGRIDETQRRDALTLRGVGSRVHAEGLAAAGVRNAAVLLPVSFQNPDPSKYPATDTSTASGAAGVPPGTATTGVPAGGPPAQQPSCVDTPTLMMMGGLFLMMYLLVLRPESKRRKEAQQMLASIKQGDRVVTTGGMHGVVAVLNDTTITLRIDAMMVTFDKSAIARVLRDDAAKDKPAGGKA